jgi:hypothetical protein
VPKPLDAFVKILLYLLETHFLSKVLQGLNEAGDLLDKHTDFMIDFDKTVATKSTFLSISQARRSRTSLDHLSDRFKRAR